MKGIAALCTGGSHYGFCIAVGMVCVSVSAAGAGIGFRTTFLVIVPQGGNYIGSIAVAAFAFMEGIALFRTGGRYNGSDIIVNQNRIVGFGDDLLLCPKAVCIIGEGQAGIGIIRRGFRLNQIPAFCPVEAPTGAVEVANGIAALGRAGNCTVGTQALAFIK